MSSEQFSIFDQGVEAVFHLCLGLLNLCLLCNGVLELVVLNSSTLVNVISYLILEPSVCLGRSLLQLLESLTDPSVLISHFFVDGCIASFSFEILSDDSIELFLDGVLQADDTFIDRLLDESQTTFPCLISHIFTIHLGFDNEEIIVLVLPCCRWLNYCCVITHDLELGLQSIVSLVFYDTAKSVSHNGNQHVQESDLSDEC